MKAYGHHTRFTLDCCPGHTRWAVQSKHSPRYRGDRAASRRPWKKAERQRVRTELREYLFYCEYAPRDWHRTELRQEMT